LEAIVPQAQEARYMRALKRTFAVVGVLAVLQYLVVYYHSVQFHEFMQQEARMAPEKNELRRTLVGKAREFSLRVTEEDINITMTGAVLRVAVDYSAPVNLLVFSPALRFHAIAAGLARE
jgi:hypothetical protein